MLRKYKDKDGLRYAVIKYTGNNFEECAAFCPNIKHYPYDNNCLRLLENNETIEWLAGEYIVKYGPGKFCKIKGETIKKVFKRIKEKKYTSKDGVTFKPAKAVPYQLCPLCNGAGKTLADGSFQTCLVCHGDRIIPMHIIN